MKIKKEKCGEQFTLARLFIHCLLDLLELSGDGNIYFFKMAVKLINAKTLPNVSHLAQPALVYGINKQSQGCTYAK